MRKLLTRGLLGVIVLTTLAIWFRGPLAFRVTRAALDRNFATDPIAELPDGLHLVLCGAGGPLPDPARSGPCVAVVAGDALFVVDSGSGAGRNLARLRLPPDHIHALFLTHFHSDHIDGLGELAILRWVGGAYETPLPVYGPEGVEEVVAGFDRAYRQDAGYRTAHHGSAIAPPSGAGMQARAFALPASGETRLLWDEGGLRVSAFRVEHEPASPAVGYRFDYGGRSALVSGDTIRSDNLLEHARDVDLLVHEALAPHLVGVVTEAASAAGRDRVATITRDILDYHTTPVQAAELAESAGARHLLYYHIVPPLPLPGLDVVFLEGVSDAYAGGVTLGRDGSMVSMPSRSKDLDVSRR
jgi:ribonuclease Z